MKKVVDLNVRCPQCGAQEYVSDTVFAGGVVLRCAHCTKGGKPTYIKNVSSDTFEALKRAGRIKQTPSYTTSYALQQPLGVAQEPIAPVQPPQPPMQPDYGVPFDCEPVAQPPQPAPQMGSMSTPDVYSTQGVAFNKPRCGCCEPDMFGTGYDEFGMPLPNKNVNLVIREHQLIIQQTRVGQEESGFAVAVEYCPICGKKV